MSQTESNSYNYHYSGKITPDRPGKVKDDRGREYDPYIPDPVLVEVVNLAIALGKPLLLEGEPGCGKTKLANAIVYEFTQNNKERLQQQKQSWWDFQIWNVNSTTRAVDGKYRYDAIARLRDAQLTGASDFISGHDLNALKERLQDRKSYREFGALGKAFRNVHDDDSHKNYRSIVLIDEIDKADSDFPNDLLLELDDMRFEIPETGEDIIAQHKPIIIITSNREKPLPQAFLRRCLYYYVPFPDASQLMEILQQRCVLTEEQIELVVTEAVRHFYEIRKSFGDRTGLNPPGTSAFLDFLTALFRLYPQSETDARDALENLAHHYPLLSTLFKTQREQEFYQKQSVAKRGERSE